MSQRGKSKSTPDQLLSTSEAAGFLRLQPQTLRKWRWVGCGPPYNRLGKSRRSQCRYKLSELIKWLGQAHNSTSEETAAQEKEAQR
ncbi:helix-turn-helix transcriptional regulator [Myxococcota bacterium]